MSYPPALKISRMGPEQLHKMVERWNWDGDNRYLHLVIQNPLCALGTALLLYWRSDPHFYRGYMSRDDVPKLHLEGYDLLKAVEEKVRKGFFGYHSIVYDPRVDMGAAVTHYYHVLPASHWDIPSFMTVATTANGIEHFTVHTLALSRPLVSPDTETYSVLVESDDYGHVTEDDLPHADNIALCWQLFKTRDTRQALSEPLSFHIGTNALSLDFMPVQRLTLFKLCSERLVNTLVNADIPFVAYPVSVFHKDTEQALSQRYFLLFPLDFSIEEMIDTQNSIITTNPETGVSRVIRPVFLAERIATAPMLFSMRGKWLVHHLLRRKLEQSHLTHLTFIPIDIASNPLVGRGILTLRQFLAEHPQEWQQWLALALKLQGLRLYKEALVAIDQGQKVKPNEWKLWKARGQLLLTMNDKEGALQAFEQAMHLHSYPWSEYCHVLRELGRYQEALAYAQRLTQEWPLVTTSWYESGMAHLAIRNTKQALEAFSHILTLKQSFATDIRIYCATFFEQAGHNEEALAFCGVEHTKLLLEIKTRILHNLGRHEEAEKIEKELQALEVRRKSNLKQGLWW